MDDHNDSQEIIELEITDTLDLHSFLPADVADVVRAYLEAAADQGFSRLRIIHGKGIGAQRRTVQKILERTPGVLSYSDAPPEAGGWGATIVLLGAGPDSGE